MREERKTEGAGEGKRDWQTEELQKQRKDKEMETNSQRRQENRQRKGVGGGGWGWRRVTDGRDPGWRRWVENAQKDKQAGKAKEDNGQKQRVFT